MIFYRAKGFQHVLPVPALVGNVANAVPVVLSTAIVLHAVNRRRATIDPATLPGVGLSGLCHGVGLVVERVLLAAIEEEEAFGNVDHGVKVRPARFQH